MIKYMDLGDFKFIAFSAGAMLTYKKLIDKRLTSRRYVSDPAIKRENWTGTMWFNIPIGTKRSHTIEEWVEDLNKLNMSWEIRQDTEKSYTVFLFCGGDKPWYHDKKVRTFESMRLEK
jgi:hypothetical protein